MRKLRVGIMGFGRVGRQIYRLALKDERFEVVAISDIGRPEILHHLLTRTDDDVGVTLSGNYLESRGVRTRLMPADHPTEIPWDVFGVDVVIEATGRFHRADDLRPHLHNGAPRVVLSALPQDDIDRVVLVGVNDCEASAADVMVSAGSASTTATALACKTITEVWPVEHATMTSVHAYTSDQSLQDYAGPDYRRSRSGAENIIPNATPALKWVQRAVPAMAGRMTGYALNVPVQVGSMLDLTFSFRESGIGADDVNDLFGNAARVRPDLIATTRDPIVSSDVRGSSESLLVDMEGTMAAGSRMVKVLAWHETLGHARRILDVVGLYADLDDATAKEAS
ncbi:MAG TPA: glyceraldehyde 3-phosphate dehydrogenase NAD-binding domain-containing protein [Pseudomonadales bacterium]|jgi:glyceraldehyde 3-phosphate dehydrogenase